MGMRILCSVFHAMLVPRFDKMAVKTKCMYNSLSFFQCVPHNEWDCRITEKNNFILSRKYLACIILLAYATIWLVHKQIMGKVFGLAQKWKFWSTWKFDKNSFVIATVSNAFPDNLFFFCCWKSINNDQVPNVQIPPHPLLLPPKIRTIQQNANSNGCQHRPHFLLKLEIFSFFVEKVRLLAVPDGCGFYVSRESLLTPPLK